MIHDTRKNTSFHASEWVKRAPTIDIYIYLPRWFVYTHEWVMTRVRIIHATHMNEWRQADCSTATQKCGNRAPWYLYAQESFLHVQYTRNESWRAYPIINWHVWMSHGINMNESWQAEYRRGGGLGSSTIFKNLMSPTPRRKWHLTTRRRAH